MAPRRARFPAPISTPLSTLAFALASLLAGCAISEGPRGREAATDPACLAPEPARPAALGAALREDPPFPGHTAPGWPARPAAEAASGSPGSLASPHDTETDSAHGEEHHGHAH